MCSILGDKTVKARKDHRCNARHFINELSIYEVFEMQKDVKEINWKELARFYRRQGKGEPEIKKGEEYRRYAISDEGTISTVKESIIGSTVCVELDLYPGC